MHSISYPPSGNDSLSYLACRTSSGRFSWRGRRSGRRRGRRFARSPASMRKAHSVIIRLIIDRHTGERKKWRGGGRPRCSATTFSVTGNPACQQCQHALECQIFQCPNVGVAYCERGVCSRQTFSKTISVSRHFCWLPQFPCRAEGMS